MTEHGWKDVAEFLLLHTVRLVNSVLLSGHSDMQEFNLMLRILGEDGNVNGEGRKRIANAYEKLARDREEVYQQQDDVEDKLEARDRLIAGLREELRSLTKKRDSSDLELLLAYKTLMIDMLVAQADRMEEKLKAAERKAEEAEKGAEEKWRAWAEKEAQVKAGKVVSAERKQWQAKGKALPVETVTIATKTYHIQEPTVAQSGEGTQTEVVLEELEKAIKRKRERKGKGRAKDTEDTVMKGGSDNSDSYREMYEALVAAPPATKKQAAPRLAAKPAGKRSRPAKTPPRSPSPDENGPLVKAMVIHGVPCQRPMADTILVGIYSHVHRTREIDHEICRVTDGGNWDMRQNVRMEAIGNSAFGNKSGRISYRIKKRQ